ncbi:MAG: glutamate synthase subunit beta [Deltaproteobacteria bacterium]|jgi:glutamate synthase (NADPH/NADH) small chain
MGKPTGFLELDRVEPCERPVEERVRDFREVGVRLPVLEARAQASRCMDCGVPFCHSQAALAGTEMSGAGCPLGNVIPEFNEHVYRGRFAQAARTLERTNNFPEVTGRVCPAPCEKSCVLELSGQPVTIEAIERAIADEDFEKNGRFVPRPAAVRTGRRVAIVGSGPAGLAAAQELAREGHGVTVFEKSERLGGLLRFGIPDFKLDKVWIDRRLAQMEAEGVVFRTGVEIGRHMTLSELGRDHDAVILAIGAEVPRALSVPGSELAGVHPAMAYLAASNRSVATGAPTPLDAKGKRVIVIGGGDTGSDCIGTAVRQGAIDVLNLELFPEPPHERTSEMPWPSWPPILRTSSSHDEAAQTFGGDVRRFALETTRLLDDGRGQVRGLEARRVEVQLDARGARRIVPVEGAEPVRFEADLVLLAMGFTGAHAAPLGVGLDARGNVAASGHATSISNVFVCGDARRGQSLVVWAIREGRECATVVSAALATKARHAA